MKISFKFILILFAIGFSNPTQAQFFKKLKNAAERGAEGAILNKTEKEAEKKTGEMMDDLLKSNDEEMKKAEKENEEKVENDERRDEQENDERVNAMLDMLSGGADVKTKDRYTFDIVATMKTVNYEDNETHLLRQGYGDNCIYTGIDEMETPVIHDFDNQAMILLHDKKEEAQVMSLSWMEKMGADAQVHYTDDNAVTVRKTGNTKSILHYHCEEYEISHKDGKMLAWFAPKVDFNFNDSFNGFSKIFKTTVDPSLFEKNGYTMSMTVFDAKGEKQSHMEVVELDQKGLDVNMKGYKVKSMFQQ